MSTYKEFLTEQSYQFLEIMAELQHEALNAYLDKLYQKLEDVPGLTNLVFPQGKLKVYKQESLNRIEVKFKWKGCDVAGKLMSGGTSISDLHMKRGSDTVNLSTVTSIAALGQRLQKGLKELDAKK